MPSLWPCAHINLEPTQQQQQQNHGLLFAFCVFFLFGCCSFRGSAIECHGVMQVFVSRSLGFVASEPALFFGTFFGALHSLRHFCILIRRWPSRLVEDGATAA